MLRPKQYQFLFFSFLYVLNLFAQDKGKTMPFSNIIFDIEQQHHVSFNYLEENIIGLEINPPKKSLSLNEKLKYLTKKTNLSFENLGNTFINIYKNDSSSSLTKNHLESHLSLVDLFSFWSH